MNMRFGFQIKDIRMKMFLRLINHARNTVTLVPSYKSVAGCPRTARTPSNEHAEINATEEESINSLQKA
jgi:hypothetical protein